MEQIKPNGIIIELQWAVINNKFYIDTFLKWEKNHLPKRIYFGKFLKTR